MADVFKALADDTRRLILDELAVRDGKTLFEICAFLAGRGLNSSQQAISQHLGVLEEAGLVTVQRSGRTKLHFFDPEPLRGLTQRWLHPHKDDP